MRFGNKERNTRNNGYPLDRELPAVCALALQYNLSQNIIAEFRKTGIFPHNPQAIALESMGPSVIIENKNGDSLGKFY